MLSTVIDRLTTLGSKYFVIGAFAPVLVFGFLNGVLLYVEFDWFHRWADPQISGTARAFDVAAVAVAVAVVAYVLWSLNAFLIDVLQGRHLRPAGWLSRTLTAVQLQRFRELRQGYFQARKTAGEIARSEARWTEGLSQAAAAGLKESDGVTDRTTNTYDGISGNAAAAIARLRALRTAAQEIGGGALQAAHDELAAVLRANNINVNHPTAGRALAADRTEFLTLIQYAKYQWEAREVALATELQWRFGPRDVAPTAFGNVAAALQSYGLTRYGINLPTFWSRLQALLLKEQELFGTLQDAKAQLDFLVACCWLTTITTAAWVVVLPFSGSSTWRFLATAIAGPIIARACYVAAVESYVAFGELVRSSVDLHRLRLLEALHVRKPSGLRDERALWSALRRVTAYGQETVDIGYHHPPDAQP
ncbi:MAG: hypothetical protein ABI818_09615 [Acidobacteriota bacterium]